MTPLRLFALLSLLCAAFGAAGCGPENVTACKEYVQARNQAYIDCGMAYRVIDEDQTCPASLNEGLNCSDYYQKLADSFRCEGGEVTWDSSGSCA